MFDETQFDWSGSFDDQIDVSNGNFEGTLAPFPSPGLTPQDIFGPPAGTADAFSDGLLIGGTSYNSFCVSEQGRIWFAAANACASNFNDVDDIALFSPLGLGSLDYTFDPTTPATGAPSVSVSLGLEDRDLDGGGSDLLNADPVLRVFWQGLNTTDTTSITFQALFYDLGGGDFDVEFNYDDDYTSLGAIQSITAPGITPYLGDPALTGAAGELFFSFRGGQLQIGQDPTSVPEPATLSLLLAGVLGLVGARGSRKRRAA